MEMIAPKPNRLVIGANAWTDANFALTDVFLGQADDAVLAEDSKKGPIDTDGIGFRPVRPPGLGSSEVGSGA
jgi:hypothetical protein